MKTIKSMLLTSRKRVREAEVSRDEVTKRVKISTGNSIKVLSPKSRTEQDAELEAVLAHFTVQMETLQAQVVQLERLERERRKLFSIIRKGKLCILLSN